MQVSISPIFGADGVIGAVVVMEDITRLKEVEKSRAKTVVALKREIERRKRAEEKLKESDSLKQAILAGITSALAFVNEELEMLWVNKAAADSVAKLPSQMGRHRCHEFWADSDKPCDGCLTGKAFKTKRSEHTTMVTPDGRGWDEKGGPVFDANWRLMGVVEIALDITDRKKAEEALRQSEEKYRRIIENTQHVIYQTDMEGRLIFASPSIQRLLGPRQI